MSVPRVLERRKDPPSWGRLAIALVLWLGASLCLFWMLWAYLPANAAMFEGLGVALPLPTRLAIYAAMWFVRLLPLLVLIGLPLLGVVCGLAVVFGARSGALGRLVRLVANVLFALALLEIVACGAIVYSVHMVFQPTEPAVIS